MGSLEEKCILNLDDLYTLCLVEWLWVQITKEVNRYSFTGVHTLQETDLKWFLPSIPKPLRPPVSIGPPHGSKVTPLHLFISTSFRKYSGSDDIGEECSGKVICFCAATCFI